MFTDRVEVLRERNKDLLEQLKLQRETLEGLRGRKRVRDDEAEETLALTRGERGAARGALGKPSVRFAEFNEIQTELPWCVSTCSKHKEERTQQSTHFSDDHVHIEPVSIRPCLVDHRETQQDESEDQTDSLAADRHHLPPLLGYDWIAGVLENDDSLMQRSDQFFDGLRNFRSLNKDECFHSTDAGFSKEVLSGSLLWKETGDLKDNTDSHSQASHQCTFSYRINSRLFPVPLHTQECCPVCRKHKSSHPHTTAEPALVRVSVPRTALLPPYKYKAHRRSSFNPSDSLGLPSHCLSGWSNTGQPPARPAHSLDLRSSLKMSATAEVTKDLQELSSQRVSSNKEAVPEVTRLAPHNFLHLYPRIKRGSRRAAHPDASSTSVGVTR